MSLRTISLVIALAVLPLPRRQQQVLQATVQHYVDTVEPVGSRTLVRRFGLDASPATVRSAMGALEQKGLLTQPHTSAGRVPSPKGYRQLRGCLLPEPGGAVLQLQRELAELSLQWAALDDLLHHLARRLADLTGLMSIITRPQRQEPQLKALRLVRSGDRLLVFLVESSAASSSLNLRLPQVSPLQLQALERWLNGQLSNMPPPSTGSPCRLSCRRGCSTTASLGQPQPRPQSSSRRSVNHGPGGLAVPARISADHQLEAPAATGGAAAP